MASSPPVRRLRRTGRKLLGLVLALLVLVVLVLAFLPAVISLEHVKRQLEIRAEQALGRQIDLGRVRLQIFSGLGATVEDLVVHNPPPWQTAHFVKAGRLSIKVALWPLLQRRVEISTLLLRDGDIVLERDEHGRMNSDALLAPQADGAPLGPVPEPPTSGGPFEALLATDISLRNVNVTFVDRMAIAGTTVTTTARALRVDVLTSAQPAPIDVELAMALLTDGEPNVRLRGRLGPLPASLDWTQVPLDLTLEATDLELDRLVPYMGSHPTLTAGRLGAALHLEGTMLDHLEVTGSVRMAEARFPDALGPGQAVTLPTISLHHDLHLRRDQGVLQVQAIRLELAHMQATLQGSVRQSSATPEFDLQLTTNEFAAADMLDALPMLAAAIPASDLQARVRLQAQVTGTLEHVHSTAQFDAEHMSLTIDDGAPLRLAHLRVLADASLDVATSTLQVASLQTHLDPLHLTLNGTLTQLTSTPQVDLQLASNQFDPGQVVATFPGLAEAFPGLAALRGRVTLQGAITGSPGAWQTKTQLTVDGLSIQSGALRKPRKSPQPG